MQRGVTVEVRGGVDLLAAERDEIRALAGLAWAGRAHR
jgi:hypothetical protein